MQLLQLLQRWRPTAAVAVGGGAGDLNARNSRELSVLPHQHILEVAQAGQAPNFLPKKLKEQFYNNEQRHFYGSKLS